MQDFIHQRKILGSSEILGLAEQAASQFVQRQDENIEEWAERIADSTSKEKD